jgi:hypothetical protein
MTGERAHGDTPGGLLAAEASAASCYWEAWSALSVRFPLRDAARLPAHWLTFGQRASLITGGPAHRYQSGERDPQLPLRCGDDPSTTVKRPAPASR